MTHGSQRSRSKGSVHRYEDCRETGTTVVYPQAQGQKVIIRLASGGQSVTGIIEGYNPYEILLQIAISAIARR
jgi:hypothetical protein